MKEKKNQFSGQIGFVLAAAGSAVGVGNLWRFMAVTALVVYNGVEDGIEKVSRFMMPVLLVLVVVIAGYSLTLKTREQTA